MFPEGFIKRIRTQQYIDADGLLKALDEPSPASIRINLSKWKSKPEKSEPVPWCNSGYYLEQRPSYTLDPLFHAGCYYPQEASSMFLEQVFRMINGDNPDYLRVLDLCGAPGGKSTHLSSLLGNNGLLVSNDPVRARAYTLAENITKWGISNTFVTRNDPEDFRRLPEFFDIILVDAPCSGEGMFRDQIAVREWSEGNMRLCEERQKRILASVWPSLKNNGALIYSTCTFNPGENEENINWLTDRHHCEIMTVDVSGFKGVAEIVNRGFVGYGFYPGRIKGDGLFITVLKKKENTELLPARIGKMKVPEPKRKDMEIISKWTDRIPETITIKGDTIISVPGSAEDYHLLDQNLNIIKHGIKVCSVKKNGYVPDHELSLSEDIREGAFPISELDYDQALLYLGRHNFSPVILHEGWSIATFRGVNIGFCNNIGTRINNYYPLNWRIKMRIPEIPEKMLISWNS